MSLLPSFCRFTRNLLSTESVLIEQIRGKAKKTAGNTRNVPKRTAPKHRGWKYQDGCVVTKGTIVATQNKLRWFPGLNVGFGKNGTLFALEHGKVVVTCEKADINWNHTWVQRLMAGREGQTIYKKYFNVIPFPQHNRFRLIDEI